MVPRADSSLADELCEQLFQYAVVLLVSFTFFSTGRGLWGGLSGFGEFSGGEATDDELSENSPHERTRPAPRKPLEHPVCLTAQKLYSIRFFLHNSSCPADSEQGKRFEYVSYPFPESFRQTRPLLSCRRPEAQHR